MPKDDPFRLIAKQAADEQPHEQDNAVTQITVVATREGIRRLMAIPDNAWSCGISPRWLIGGECRVVHVGQTGEIHVKFNGFPGLRQENALFPSDIACVVTIVMPMEHLTVFPGKHPELERKMSRIARKFILLQEKAAEDVIKAIADEAPGSAGAKEIENLHPASCKGRQGA